MKHLVYGILRNDGRAWSSPVAGLEGRPLGLVTQDGIGAACSEVAETFAASDASQAMAYARVVEALHRTGTVLPMRYGCLFHDREQIAQFLQRQSTELKESLEDVDGCEEMGVRALLSGPAPPLAAGGPTVSDRLGVDRRVATPGSGADYLASREAAYAERDRSREEAPELTDAILHALDGLFLKSKAEQSATHGTALLSLHLLIPRAGMDAFRRAFRRLRPQSDRALLLTGPWPPYNFVSRGKV